MIERLDGAILWSGLLGKTESLGFVERLRQTDGRKNKMSGIIAVTA